MRCRKASGPKRDSSASIRSEGATESSEAITSTESAVSHDLPAVNVDPAYGDEDPTDDSYTDQVGAQLADLDLSPSRTGGLETPSTARDLYNATPRTSFSPEPHIHNRESHLGLAADVGNDDQPENDVVHGIRRLSLASPSKPYDTRDERLPSERFFDRHFQQCLKSGKELAEALHIGLSQCSLSSQPNSELGRLRTLADKLRNFESPATRRVGIVGDSGAGKLSNL